VVRGGEAPSPKPLPPLLEKERGIKGVRLRNNLTKGGGENEGKNVAFKNLLT
jgi:hypothetical protein